ncbi:hypothetical protein BG015_009781 [Linnemannia schmuckeri]|uniref:F-box domain-containing protein n=1 Tax=Linnemannia schmuckeri TaxID=64567 RepID=A0A9P5V9P7_9FUNG|nr:hypothetical protein BG015_009781 [Linnemannia schmuckeri]
MDTIKRPVHLLELPEIRTRIAFFLCNSDCISCMRVNKAWHKDFAGSVWHTIDFEKSESFSHVAPATIVKYGHLIRQVKNVAKEEHLFLLQRSNVSSLIRLGFLVTNNPRPQGLFYDIFRRNKSTLRVFDVSSRLIEATTYSEQLQNKALFLSIDLPASGSKLTHLYLGGLCLTRANFSDVLRCSPHLQSVKLIDNIFYSHDPSFEVFRHQGVKMLSAPLSQVWITKRHTPNAPSLLIHFPQLETWENITHCVPEMPISALALQNELNHHCPRLNTVHFDDEESDPMAIAIIYVKALAGIKDCQLWYKTLNQTSFLGIFGHKETLTHIRLDCFTPDVPIVSMSDPNPSVKSLVSIIFQICPLLEVFSAKAHQMDIAAAEKYKWVCGGLRELSIRFKGLDTVPAVDDCLERLSLLHSRDGGLRHEIGGNYIGADSVGYRVCRKLLSIKKLKTVWLGTRNYYLATS